MEKQCSYKADPSPRVLPPSLEAQRWRGWAEARLLLWLLFRRPPSAQPASHCSGQNWACVCEHALIELEPHPEGTNKFSYKYCYCNIMWQFGGIVVEEESGVFSPTVCVCVRVFNESEDPIVLKYVCIFSQKCLLHPLTAVWSVKRLRCEIGSFLTLASPSFLPPFLPSVLLSFQWLPTDPLTCTFVAF